MEPLYRSAVQSQSVKTTRKPLIRALLCLSVLLSAPFCLGKGDGELLIELVDSETGQPVATRIHLRNSRGRTVRARGWGLAPHADHAYIDGSTTLELRRGPYRFDLDAGPEYRTLAGHFEIDRDASDSKKIELRRFTNLAEEGWYAADLVAMRRPLDYEFLCRAEQLAYFAHIGWKWDKKAGWKNTGKIAKGHQPPASSSALWETRQGTVWLHDPTGTLTIEQLPAFAKDSVPFLITARANGWVVVASPTSWELPIWIAHDLVDALLVIDGLAESKSDKAKKPPGRRSDLQRFTGARGIGRWREAIHHQLLEAGIYLPAVAGSGSGLNDRPLGTSRVYFHADESTPYDEHETVTPNRADAWRQILAGATVITNGPLLRPWVEGSPPGVELELSENVSTDAPREVHIALNMATRAKVDYLELIQNGQVAKSVRLMDWAAAGGKLPPLEFDTPGWFLIRAVTENTEQYQFASSGPYFIGKQGERSTARAAQFFLDWLDDYVSEFNLTDESPEFTGYIEAKAFWQQRLDHATTP